MRFSFPPRALRFAPRILVRFPYVWVETALLALLAVLCAHLFWAVFTPLGPIGRWTAGGRIIAADTTLFSRFDPFFRLGAPSGATVVTSLPVKLFGVRLDEATGRGSAIIATPDGVQSSFAVGDEIMPGIILKTVAFDNVTIERGGVAEQLFLDQSVAAPVAQSGAAAAPGAGGGVTAAMLRDAIGFAPRLENGAVTGFVVSPRGAGDVFRNIGFQPGDIVTSINGAGFRSPEEAIRALGAVPPNAMATFAVERSGKIVMLSTKVGS